MNNRINTYEEYLAWNKRCAEERRLLAGIDISRGIVMDGVNRAPSDPEVEPPKQTTEEVGHWTTPVTEFHARVADTMLDYVYLTSDFTRGMFMMDFAGNNGPDPNGLLQQKMSDGYWKIKGGLPPEEYRKLIGAQTWDSIVGKYEDEKYLVYDDEQEKDPATQLFPEFYLMFRLGCYISWNFKRYDGDPQPKVEITLKSHKEYIGG